LLQQTVQLPADTLLNDTTLVAAEPQASTFLDILVQGGPVMIPIALLSVLTVYVFVERLITIHRSRTDRAAVVNRVRDYVQAGDISGAVAYCESRDKPLTRILKQGLERLGRPISEIQDAVHNAGRHEAFDLEKRTDLLASVAGIAPMLGFLGTVTGMIEAFQTIQRLQGNVNPSVLAGGIWEALITTAAGLVVGIPALFAYNYLRTLIGRLVNDLERSATEFIDLLQEPAPPEPRYEKLY
jgi:biopolymer transport protein ExbB